MSLSLLLPELSGMQSIYFLRIMILSDVTCLAQPYFSTLSHKVQLMVF
jgi:hypothetical protein